MSYNCILLLSCAPRYHYIFYFTIEPRRWNFYRVQLINECTQWIVSVIIFIFANPFLNVANYIQHCNAGSYFAGNFDAVTPKLHWCQWVVQWRWLDWLISVALSASTYLICAHLGTQLSTHYRWSTPFLFMLVRLICMKSNAYRSRILQQPDRL